MVFRFGSVESCIILSDYPPRVHRYSFASDASGRIGCGAIWASSWFQFKWAEAEGVQFHELGGDSLPVVLAVAVWGPHWRDSSALVYCDNQGAVSVVNSGYSSKDNAFTKVFF